MALTMEGNAESSKDTGHERTNSCRETVGMGQLRWEGECVNVTSPFVILGVTVSGVAGERLKNHRIRQRGSSFGKRISIFISRDTSIDRGSIKSLNRHCWKVMRHETRNFKGVLARDTRKPLKVE